MGLPVTIYRYTDQGAPQLTNGTPSEWIDILKKCLVTGYGTKAGLGWTIEFENAGAYKIAFRNKVADGGSGGYVQFWSATGANAANTGINIKTAASMSALDTFVKPGYMRQVYMLSAFRGWEIIGTSRGFWVIPHPTTVTTINPPTSASNQWGQQYFIGDVESFVAGDQCPFGLFSGTSTAADVTGSSSNGVVVNSSNRLNYILLYAVDGSNSSESYSADRLHDVTATINGGDAESLGINHVMIRPMLTGTTSLNNNTVLPFARGFVPGYYISNFSGYHNNNWPKDIIINGVTWTLLRCSYANRHWIKAGTWYD